MWEEDNIVRAYNPQKLEISSKLTNPPPPSLFAPDYLQKFSKYFWISINYDAAMVQIAFSKLQPRYWW